MGGAALHQAHGHGNEVGNPSADLKSVKLCSENSMNDRQGSGMANQMFDAFMRFSGRMHNIVYFLGCLHANSMAGCKPGAAPEAVR